MSAYDVIIKDYVYLAADHNYSRIFPIDFLRRFNEKRRIEV